MARMYFAEFTDTSTGKIFYKFGHTSFKDAQDRLDRITEEFPKFKARVLASAFHFERVKAQGAEEAFQAMYPKNFWLDEKISGITECVELTSDEKSTIIQAVRRLNDKFKKECFGENRA